MRHLIALLATCSLLLSPPAFADQPGARQHAQSVKDFIAAFNAQDSAEMSKFVAEDVQWLSISAATVSIDASGVQPGVGPHCGT